MSSKKKAPAAAAPRPGTVTLHVEALEVHLVVAVRDHLGRFKRRMKVGVSGNPIEVPESDFEELGLAAFVKKHEEQIAGLAAAKPEEG